MMTNKASYDRRGRAAMLAAVRELRRSIANGRPITLPNLLRLARRRNGSDSIPPNHFNRLRCLYVEHQPFRAGRIALRDCRQL